VSELRLLPADAKTTVARPPAGYNYRADVIVGGMAVTTLLDTGATTNAVAEEVVLAIIDHALGRGFVPGDPQWPVRLEKWGKPDLVKGVARGRALEIIGAAVLQVTFRGIDKREVVQGVRFKIFAKGSCGWLGLVIGGPSLEPAPLGLGLRSYGGGHFLQTLGITLLRAEEGEVAERVNAYYALQELEKEARGPLAYPASDVWEERTEDEKLEGEGDVTWCRTRRRRKAGRPERMESPIGKPVALGPGLEDAGDDGESKDRDCGVCSTVMRWVVSPWSNQVRPGKEGDEGVGTTEGTGGAAVGATALGLKDGKEGGPGPVQEVARGGPEDRGVATGDGGRRGVQGKEIGRTSEVATRSEERMMEGLRCRDDGRRKNQCEGAVRQNGLRSRGSGDLMRKEGWTGIFSAIWGQIGGGQGPALQKDAMGR